MDGQATAGPTLRAARTAVAWVFAANGFAFAGWASRLPALRDAFGLSPARVGLVLLAVSVGSLATLPLAGAVVHRAGTARTVLVCGVAGSAGIAVIGLSSAITGVVIGFATFGAASGVWDVAMNVEGAEVERRLGRAILPRFHAAWSLGTVAGAAMGSLAARAGVPLDVHLPTVAAVVLVVVVLATRRFLPVPAGRRPAGRRRRSASGSLAAWSEPRTLALGALVLCFAFAEGSANDWLALGLVDGYRVGHAAAAAGFAVFVAAMTLGRMTGPWVLGRFGRVTVLRSGRLPGGARASSSSSAAPGSVVATATSLARAAAVALLAAICWGVGVSLGFPVGLSAAADEPSRAPARVGVVATHRVHRLPGRPAPAGSAGRPGRHRGGARRRPGAGRVRGAPRRCRPPDPPGRGRPAGIGVRDVHGSATRSG